MKTWMVVPDLQVPLHDENFVEKLIDVARYIKPDGLLFIGDLTDSTEVGRWVKGKSGEYSGKLQASFDKTADIVSSFRAAVGDDAEMILQGSNHDSRTRQYIADNAPALSSLRSLDFARLVGLEDNGVAYVHGVHAFLPGVVSVHGHERASSSVAGKWGLDRVHEYGANVVYGHTHTPLVISTAIGVSPNRQEMWTMNVGHGMRMDGATYLPDGYATWAQAFGLIHHDGVNAYPELVISAAGRFVLDEKIW